MARRPTRGLAIASVALGGLALGLAAIGRGAPAPQDPAAPPAANKSLTVRYFLADSCAECHVENKGKKPVPNFVKHSEYTDWKDHDKHSSAFASLSNETGKRMAANLGTDVTKAKECLNCHAPAVNQPVLANDPKSPEKRIAEGVSCAACHGPYEEWVDAHKKLEGEEQWIARKAEDKRDNFGMTDLRDPAVRAETCASCHVGDVKQGRVVTHQMYAAGHPPLPGLEVATFSEAQPPHWWPMKDVPYLKQTNQELAKRFEGNKEPQKDLINFNVMRKQHYKVDEFPTQHAKLVAVGGLVTFREAAKLFADTGDLQGTKSAGLPDFARFDCAACHHELRVSDASFRQARGYAADPGRPPTANWPDVLAFVGIEAGNKDQVESRTGELEAALKRFRDLAADRPFGDPKATSDEARKLVTWVDGIIREIDAQRLDRDSAIRMLKRIAKSPVPDHASARQLAWAFRTIYNELDPKPANDKEITETVDSLIKALQIAILPGNKPGTVEREVGGRLDADERFDPEAVARLFDRLNDLLK